LNLPTVGLAFYGPTVTLASGANVTAKTVTYQTDALNLNNAVTTVDDVAGWINIVSNTKNKAITVQATDPADGSLWLNSSKLGQFVTPQLTFGSLMNNVPWNTGAISINSDITGSDTTFRNLSLLTTGAISQPNGKIVLPAINGITCPNCGTLSVIGGTGAVALDNINNAVSTFSATTTTGAISFANSTSFMAGGETGVRTAGGNLTLAAPADGSSIDVLEPGIDACYGMTSGCTSTVMLSAKNSLSLPLVRAGSTVSLYADTGSITDADGTANNIVSGNDSGSVTLNYQAPLGTVDLDAWGATQGPTRTAITDNVRWTQPGGVLDWISWIYGGNGLWSLASNWSGSNIPDSTSEGAAIPSGLTVTFDASAGAVNLGGVNSSGTLEITGGTLNIIGDFTSAGYIQSGGAISATNFTVTDNFLRSAGAAAVTGALAITQTTGNLSPGAWTVGGPVSFTAAGAGSDVIIDGDISKTAGGNANMDVKAARSIVVGAPISSTSGKLDVTLNAHYLTNGAVGNVSIVDSISTNGGNLVVGGGLTPASIPAIGYDGTSINNDKLYGVNVETANISTGGGNIDIRGQGVANSTFNADGISLSVSQLHAGGGNITLEGKSGDQPTNATNSIYFATAIIDTTGSGSIKITGTAGASGTNAIRGVNIYKGTIQTEDGDIEITGTGGDSSHSGNNGVLISGGSSNTVNISSTGIGSMAITGGPLHRPRAYPLPTPIPQPLLAPETLY